MIAGMVGVAHSGLHRLRRWAAVVKSDVVALWLAARDVRVPLIAKIVAAGVAAYALSPIDLIPDFIPVFGLLDDVILVPLGIALAVRLTPPPLMAEFRAIAAARGHRPQSRAGAVVIIAAWATMTMTLAWWLAR